MTIDSSIWPAIAYPIYHRNTYTGVYYISYAITLCCQHNKKYKENDNFDPNFFCILMGIANT